MPEARRARTVSVKKIDIGNVIDKHGLATAAGELIEIPDAKRLVHLQFRRFAGCPFCSVHLRYFVQRHAEITAVGIREVVVFRSTAELLQRHHGNVPYTVILDPKGKLYTELAVTTHSEGSVKPCLNLTQTGDYHE